MYRKDWMNGVYPEVIDFKKSPVRKPKIEEV